MSDTRRRSARAPDERKAHVTTTAVDSKSLFESRGVVFALSLFVGVALTWSSVSAVWKSNRFFDTDDAMHLVQVRDWLSGQGWFDMTERRLDPPVGTLMHWTRVTDLPLGALIRFFGLFAPSDTAERLTRIAYPLGLQFCLYAAMLWTARKLLGFRGVAAACLLTAFSLSVMIQFPPGRINHHNAQILILVLMLGCAIDALDRMRAARACVTAAALAALSLSITLEDLPFIGVLIAAFAVVWVIRGQAFGAAMIWFGGALCVTLGFAFAATVPLSLYDSRVCDAFSLAHLAPGEVGGIGFVVLGAFGSRLRDVRARILACAGAGAITTAVLIVVAPHCVGNPYEAVDPLVNSVWLAHVSEAQPLGSLIRSDLPKALPIAIPLGLGAVLALCAALRNHGDRRLRWFLACCFLWTGFLGSFWEVIVGTYGAVFAGLGAAWGIETLVESSFGSKAGRAALASLLALASIPHTWALATVRFDKPNVDQIACFSADAFKAFVSLAPGLVLAPIDAGPYILVYSDQSVVDGPYHRDNRGNRLAIEAFTSPPDVARQKIHAAGADYLALCPNSEEALLYARLAPQGLATVLARSNVPSWLSEVSPKGSRYLIFKVN